MKKALFPILLLLILSACSQTEQLPISDEALATSPQIQLTLTPTKNSTPQPSPTNQEITTATPTATPFVDERLKNKVLVINSKNTVKLIDLSDNSPIMSLPPLTSSTRDSLFWSPNGQYVAYQDYRDGISGIYYTDILTREEKLIQTNDNEDGIWSSYHTMGNWISWSPDGSTIAFESVSGNAEDIFIYNLENQELQNLTNSPSHDFGIDFSPKGDTLAYISYQDDLLQIYSVSIDGSKITQLTNFSEAINISFPTWSPDGERIAFKTIPVQYPFDNTKRITPDLFVMSSDGSNIEQLLSSEEYDCNRCYESIWSPNSDAIVFTSKHETNYNIYSISIETKEINQLSVDRGTDQGIIGWISDDLLLYEEVENGKETLCKTNVFDWQCDEILAISENELIYQYSIIEFSN